MLRFRHDIALISTVALAAACASPTSQASQHAPVTSARPGSPVTLQEPQITTLAMLLRMEDQRVLDTTLVRRALGDPSAAVRRRAVLAAGRTGDRMASELLRIGAADADDEAAADAAFAMGEIGDTASANLAVLRAMMFRPTGGPAAREAANAMGKLVRTSAYGTLASALQSTTTGPIAASDVIPEVLLAIWRHPRQPQTAALIIPFATATDSATRYAAVYALARAPRPAGVSALMHAARDPLPLIRETAVRGLRAALADSVQLRDSARTTLLSALRDTSSHVRINAVQTLAGYKENALVTQITALLNDADVNVRIAAATALASFGSEGAAALMGVVQTPAAPLALRATALSGAISASKGALDIAMTEARSWARSDSWLQRLYGVRALGAAPFGAVSQDLIAAVRDKDPRVDGEALGAVSAADTADTTHALDALYLESLASADPIVRSTAIGALARHRDVVFLSALMDAYGRAQSDRENDAALAAVDALASLARADSAIARSFFLRFKPSPDPLIRAAVANRFGTGSGTWGAPGPAANRPLAFYENVIRTLVAPVLAGAPRPRFAIHSAAGDITVELASDEAPLTVQSFFSLIDAGYFTKSSFRWHRVVPNFVLQDGDPRGDGSGGPGYSIRDEINRLRYTRGAVGMALSGPDTGGSQFFITHSPQPHLDGGYTVFGYVVRGMDIADRVVQDEAIHGIDVIR